MSEDWLNRLIRESQRAAEEREEKKRQEELLRREEELREETQRIKEIIEKKELEERGRKENEWRRERRDTEARMNEALECIKKAIKLNPEYRKDLFSYTIDWLETLSEKSLRMLVVNKTRIIMLSNMELVSGLPLESRQKLERLLERLESYEEQLRKEEEQRKKELERRAKEQKEREEQKKKEREEWQRKKEKAKIQSTGGLIGFAIFLFLFLFCLALGGPISSILTGVAALASLAAFFYGEYNK